MDTLKDVVQNSVNVPKFDKNLKKVRGHIGRNVVEIAIKMKTIVRKNLDKNCRLDIKFGQFIDGELVKVLKNLKTEMTPDV